MAALSKKSPPPIPMINRYIRSITTLLWHVLIIFFSPTKILPHFIITLVHVHVCLHIQNSCLQAALSIDHQKHTTPPHVASTAWLYMYNVHRSGLMFLRPTLANIPSYNSLPNLVISVQIAPSEWSWEARHSKLISTQKHAPSSVWSKHAGKAGRQARQAGRQAGKAGKAGRQAGRQAECMQAETSMGKPFLKQKKKQKQNKTNMASWVNLITDAEYKQCHIIFCPNHESALILISVEMPAYFRMKLVQYRQQCWVVLSCCHVNKQYSYLY